jgi:membrane protease YdiL (CAAX protease family)
MSAVVEARDVRPRIEPVTAVAVGLFAVMFLLSRPAIAPIGAPALAAGYGLLGMGSVLALRLSLPARAHGRGHAADPWFPLAIGAGAVLVARLAAGAAPPLPVSLTIVTLNTAAAIAEEAFFRGFLFGRLEGWGVRAAVVGSSVAFALIHLPLYGWSAFPVDIGAGLLFAWQRAASGRWTVPAVTHTFANLLAVLR